MTYNLFKRRGFTLIELLIVVAIIALLTGIVITSLGGARSKSRDGKRVSDVAQIQLALEQFFDRCQQYPTSLSTSATVSTCPSGITLGSFITAIPTPLPGGSVTQTQYSYAYQVSSGANIDYVLGAVTEKPVVPAGLSAFPSTSGWTTSYWLNSSGNNTPTCDTNTNYCVTSK